MRACCVNMWVGGRLRDSMVGSSVACLAMEEEAVSMPTSPLIVYSNRKLILSDFGQVRQPFLPSLVCGGLFWAYPGPRCTVLSLGTGIPDEYGRISGPFPAQPTLSGWGSQQLSEISREGHLVFCCL